MPSRAVLLGCTGWLLLPVVFLATRNAYSPQPGGGFTRMQVHPWKPREADALSDGLKETLPVVGSSSLEKEKLAAERAAVKRKMVELLRKQRELDKMSKELNARKDGSVFAASKGSVPTDQEVERLEQEIEAVAKPKGASHAITTLTGGVPLLQTSDRLHQYFPNFLFVVYTDKIFRKTRLQSILHTWGSLIDSRSLIIIGDEAAQNVSGSGKHVLETGCQKSSHWEGACCKYAMALYEVSARMRAAANIEAAFLFDDDSYLRPAATAEAIVQMARLHSEPAMFGIFGCVTKLCHGLCAGAGYGINRPGVMRMTTNADGTALSKDDFLKEQMASCKKCERWADQALTDVAINHKVKLVNYKGQEIHGWALKKKDFKDSVERPKEPLLWHYVKSTFQYDFMHRLFQPGPIKTKQCWAVTETDRVKAKQEYEAPGGMCATFRGRTCCMKRQELALTGILHRRLQAARDSQCWYGVYSGDLKLECRCKTAAPLYSSAAALPSLQDSHVDASGAHGGLVAVSNSSLAVVDPDTLPSLQSIIDAQGLSGPWPLATLAERFHCE
mmetsp:Transcript_50738/g.93812  ORF Transcript_50738/g.93812 Transcript_50738/m.93812 type:complete len:558 (-) Transcript_50738:74-1747(-)